MVGVGLRGTGATRQRLEPFIAKPWDRTMFPNQLRLHLIHDPVVACFYMMTLLIAHGSVVSAEVMVLR